MFVSFRFVSFFWFSLSNILVVWVFVSFSFNFVLHADLRWCTLWLLGGRKKAVLTSVNYHLTLNTYQPTKNSDYTFFLSIIAPVMLLTDMPSTTMTVIFVWILSLISSRSFLRFIRCQSPHCCWHDDCVLLSARGRGKTTAHGNMGEGTPNENITKRNETKRKLTITLFAELDKAAAHWPSARILWRVHCYLLCLAR